MPIPPPESRALPANPEAEIAVLGAILLDNDAVDLATDILKTEDFHSEGNSLIFGAMLSLRGRGEPLDPVTIAAALGGDLERAGGLGYLSTLMDGLPRTLNVAEYARIVKEKSSLRRLARLGEDLRDAAIADEDTADLLVTIAATDTGNGGPPEESILAEVKRQRVRREARRRLDAEERVGDTIPDPVTLRELIAEPDVEEDWRIARVQPGGTRVLLAAQTGAGKTEIVNNLMRTVLDGDDFLERYGATRISGAVALLDFEMGRRQLRDWLRAQRIHHDDRLIVFPMRGRASAFDIMDESVRELWAERLRDLGVEYAVLDCLRPCLDSLGLDENHDAGVFLVAFDRLLVDAGIPDAVVVHHFGHVHERSRGDSRIRDWCDVEWTLVRQGSESDAPRFFRAFGRDVDEPEQQLVFDSSTRRLRIAGGSRKDAATGDALAAVISVLEEATEPLSGNAITSTLADSDHSRSAIRTALKLGIYSGDIATEEGPRRAVLHRVSSAPAYSNPNGQLDLTSAPPRAAHSKATPSRDLPGKSASAPEFAGSAPAQSPVSAPPTIGRRRTSRDASHVDNEAIEL